MAVELEPKRVANMLSNPPRKRESRITTQGQSHGRGGRKHTIANVLITPMNPFDNPGLCPTWKAQGECLQHAENKCNKSHPGLIHIPVGTGSDIMVNNQPYHEYFRRWSHRSDVTSPLLLTNTLGRFRVAATVSGGGLTGQAQAVRHGLARALQFFDPRFRPPLKLANLLSRDPRVVERKKWGQYKARKKHAWVKR